MDKFELMSFEIRFDSDVVKKSYLMCDKEGNLTFEGDLHPSNAAQNLFDNLQGYIKEQLVKNP